ncbi:S1 family peptidase [Planctomyces sp. SH-PL14]|uniref:S1 family peptidase n=1 Tax=Planctomyces sp. SH-PL14 TaxID=1632864 RepID=UPI00078B8C42|nr:trypsin-like serine protease [Planctomyces sp. SH-PL14]AMV18358.1 Trypsin [Planctomyces sp. SH-PL14]
MKKSLCLAVLLLVFASKTTAQQFSQDVEMIAFDDTGNLIPASAQRLNVILNQPGTPPPTDVYIVAHGWNNSFSEARASYRKMMDQMRAVANRHTLLDASYRSLIVGVSWPSKAWDEEPQGRSLTDEGTSDSDLLTLYRVFPAALGNGTYEQDILTMQQLLATAPESLTVADYQVAEDLFRKYRLKGEDADDDGVFLFATDGRGLFDSRFSIRNGLRMFTYWQMKERAGVIGQKGVRPKLIDRIHVAYPQARVHLLGHSFGCKMMLACLAANQPPVRKVESLVLLQGAVSYQAMSPIGSYANVTTRVAGPILATFSEHDSALGLPYELASQVAGQTAERSASVYSALGRVGAEIGQRITIVDDQAADPYVLRPGVYSADGRRYVLEHSDFFNAAVARLIWSAVRPQATGVQPTDHGPARSLGRGRSSDELRGAAQRASKLVAASGDLPDRAIFQLFVESVDSQLAAPSQADALGTVADSITFPPLSITLDEPGGFNLTAARPLRVDINRSLVRSSLRSKLIDEQFILVDSYRKNVRQMIIDGRADAGVERVLGDCGQRDGDFKQCVAVGWRRKGLDGDWSWEGSGTLVDSNFVLTAGHVVPDGLRLRAPAERIDTIANRWEFAVLIGNDVSAERPTIKRVKLRHEHPEFDGIRYRHDLALLELVDPVKPADLGLADGAALPIQPAATEVWNNVTPQLVTLVGFGSCNRTADPESFGSRRAAPDVPVGIPASESDARILGCNFPWEFAAGGMGVDTCKGDSGGPVFFFDGTKYWLVGVTSRAAHINVAAGISVAAPQISPCGDGGVYVWIGKYLDTWIRPAMRAARASGATTGTGN